MAIQQVPGARDAGPYAGGRSLEPDNWTILSDPYRGDPAARVGTSGPVQVRKAVDAALEGQREVASLAVHRRAAILRRAADLIEASPERYAASITRQTGKALKNTLREVRRSAWTMRGAATAIEQLEGRVHAADAAPEGEGLVAFSIRRPLGVIGAITPFNAPFNLVVHKVAPAFAAGNAIVVKPASQAPLAALDVARLMEEAGAPPGAVNIVPGDRKTVEALAADERVRMFTFTGSRSAGESIARMAGARRVTLELGGNSPNIVHSDAVVASAASACVSGGFSNTGQSCNSVQRIIVHRDIAGDLSTRVVELVRRLVVGDPLDPATDVGTLVDEPAAIRVETWLEEASAMGSRTLINGERRGAQLDPAVVADAPMDTRLVCEEVFGPVVVILSYRTIDEAISIANATPYGLQSAVFTASLDMAMRVAREVDSGTVLVNRSSNFRLDHLPYGGVKASGIGREGPAAAVEEMTEQKLVIVARANPDPVV